MSVVNVKVDQIRPKYSNLKEWTDDPDNIYIGRGRIAYIDGLRFPPADSIWANPFKIGKDGTRDQVLEYYRKYLLSRSDLIEQLPTLKNKLLGCWCKPESCHGDILLEMINQPE